MSGLKIYNASPLFGFSIPSEITLGGWLAGARQWHFFGMWILLINGIIWVVYNVISKHGQTTTLFRKSDVSGILPMMRYYLRLQKDHPPSKKYNSLQKLTYTVIPFLGAGSVLSGIALYWPVQFSWIASSFGGYESARLFHFIFTVSFILFFFGHIFMVVISGWSNFVSIITGWKKLPS